MLELYVHYAGADAGFQEMEVKLLCMCKSFGQAHKLINHVP